MTEPSVSLRVRDIGEQGLLKRLHQFCPPDVVGDDAALLAIAPGQKAVMTTDMLVDGVHFSSGLSSLPQTMSAADVGWRSAAANLSDLAAMGAQPLGITVSLSLPGNLPVAWVEHLYQGMVECLEPWGAMIAGGDVCRSSLITIAITAVGQVDPDDAIWRSQARVGDAIVATGLHGSSRAGLELLLHPDQRNELSQGDRTYFIQAHQRPVPRFDAVSVLRDLRKCKASPVRVAGMDSSDGLADAVLQICRASYTGAQLMEPQLPIPSALNAWVGAEKALEWTLYGGEDFELILCLPPDEAQWVVQALKGDCRIIGSITADSAVTLNDAEGTVLRTLSLDEGFQHFA